MKNKRWLLAGVLVWIALIACSVVAWGQSTVDYGAACAECWHSKLDAPPLPIDVRPTNTWNLTPADMQLVEENASAFGWTAENTSIPCLGCIAGDVTFKGVVTCSFTYNGAVLSLTITDLPWYISRAMLWGQVQAWMPTNIYANF
jgi:hypothetical protein